MSSPSNTKQKEEEERRMELGKVAEKFRESTGRRNGRTKRGLLRAWRFQGETPGGGGRVPFGHLSFLRCVGQEHVFRVQVEETAVKVKLNCSISPDPWELGMQAGGGWAPSVGLPKKVTQRAWCHPAPNGPVAPVIPVLGSACCPSNLCSQPGVGPGSPTRLHCCCGPFSSPGD